MLPYFIDKQESAVDDFWYSDVRILDLLNYFEIHSAYQILYFIIVFLLLSIFYDFLLKNVNRPLFFGPLS